MRLALAMAADVPAPEPREPGAPIPKDEIDPELVSLRPRTQVGLLTSFAIVVFCVHLAVKLLPDFRFSREGKPAAVGVGEILDGKVASDRNIMVFLDLERAAAVRIRQSAGIPGLRVAPVVGSRDKLWVALDGDGWAYPRKDRMYVGRLRKLSALPFESPLRAYARAHPSPRFVSADELRSVSAEPYKFLTAVNGDTFEAAPSDVVEIVVPDPDAVTVIGSYGARQPDAEAWQHQLEGALAAGVTGSYEVKLRKADDHQAWFDVHFKGAHDAAAKLLEHAKLWGGRVDAITVQYRAPYETVKTGADGVRIMDATLPWSAVDVVAFHSARDVPGDPWVLIAGELPSQYWYLSTVYVLLGIFALLFGWALVRTARRELFVPKVPTGA